MISDKRSQGFFIYLMRKDEKNKELKLNLKKENGEMIMEKRNEWIANYLKGKKVTKADLKEFFTIENNENKVRGKKAGENMVLYITDKCEYTISLEPVNNSTTNFIVKEVYYE